MVTLQTDNQATLSLDTQHDMHIYNLQEKRDFLDISSDKKENKNGIKNNKRKVLFVSFRDGENNVYANPPLISTACRLGL